MTKVVERMIETIDDLFLVPNELLAEVNKKVEK